MEGGQADWLLLGPCYSGRDGSAAASTRYAPFDFDSGQSTAVLVSLHVAGYHTHCTLVYVIFRVVARMIEKDSCHVLISFH